jgi:hypothetical protein
MLDIDDAALDQADWDDGPLGDQDDLLSSFRRLREKHKAARGGNDQTEGGDQLALSDEEEYSTYERRY